MAINVHIYNMITPRNMLNLANNFSITDAGDVAGLLRNNHTYSSIAKLLKVLSIDFDFTCDLVNVGQDSVVVNQSGRISGVRKAAICFQTLKLPAKTIISFRAAVTNSF